MNYVCRYVCNADALIPIKDLYQSTFERTRGAIVRDPKMNEFASPNSGICHGIKSWNFNLTSVSNGIRVRHHNVNTRVQYNNKPKKAKSIVCFCSPK